MHVSNPLVPIMLKLQGIRYGRKCAFYGIPVIVKKRGSITIGDRLTLISGFLSNLVGLYQRSVILARDGGRIVIGSDVGMSGVTVYAFKHIEIGDHTKIGANTKIFDSDFHPVDPEYRLKNCDDKEHTKMKETVIGKNVFIGCNCLILKGVHIGDNSVIGAGSVVSKDVPANCVAAGNPAVAVKYFSDSTSKGE